MPEVTGEASDTGGAHRPRVHLKVQSTQVLDAPFQHQRVKSLCHQERTAQCPIHSKDRQGPSPQTEPWTWQAGKGDSLLNSEARSGPAAHSICAPPPHSRPQGSSTTVHLAGCRGFDGAPHGTRCSQHLPGAGLPRPGEGLPLLPPESAKGWNGQLRTTNQQGGLSDAESAAWWKGRRARRHLLRQARGLCGWDAEPVAQRGQRPRREREQLGALALYHF